MNQPLLLILVGVPPTPSSLRVRVWRRLRSLGAVPLKRSAYLLPDTPERYEDFQWLAQEIQREGGDATLIRVQQIENMSPELVQRLFHEPRDHDYRQLAARYRTAMGSVPVTQVVCYCGSGVTAAHDAFAMAHAGLGDARVYAGSWSEWILDPARPVRTGEAR